VKICAQNAGGIILINGYFEDREGNEKITLRWILQKMLLEWAVNGTGSGCYAVAA
jgi:hypothetical protein